MKMEYDGRKPEPPYECRCKEHIAALTAALAARDAECKEYKIAFADSEEECIDLRGALKKRDAEVERLRAECEAYRERIDHAVRLIVLRRTWQEILIALSGEVGDAKA